MSLEFVRIDDRLVHGQVVIGWCAHVRPDRIVLCNDAVAASSLKQAIYKDAAADYHLDICDVAETVELLRNPAVQRDRIVLIVESPDVIIKLLDLGVVIKKVNVGGLHQQEGKREIAPSVYVNPEDVRCLRLLSQRHIELDSREVPSSEATDIEICL